MSRQFPEHASGPNVPEFTVSEISGNVKRIIEGAFPRVRIRGEVGRVSRPQSGHVYLDLKDQGAVLSAVVWRSSASRLATRPQEGLEVVATGRLTTFAGQSRYQLIIDDIAPAGIGALMAMLEQRRKKLEAEGLFAAERKRPIPFLPDVIGIVTSPSGAVIRDILHRLRDRFPRTVLLWPVAVQGENCTAEVVDAVTRFNALDPGGDVPRPDLLIVARGGGSVEDLWEFNSEPIVRAVAASRIPVISAIGHETDTTLIDHAADVRAPTPTAAAELAVPVRSELLGKLASVSERGVRAQTAALGQRRQRLRDLFRAMPRPDEYVAMQGQRLDIAAGRLERGLRGAVRMQVGRLSEASAGLRLSSLHRNIAQSRTLLERSAAALALADRRHRDMLRTRFDNLGRLLGSLGYQATLERGFAVVREEDRTGPVISSAGVAARTRSMVIQFRDGEVGAAPLAADRES